MRRRRQFRTVARPGVVRADERMSGASFLADLQVNVVQPAFAALHDQPVQYRKRPMIESISAGVSARNTRVVLFDFDGTLSLIRSGWMQVMVPMMVDILLNLKTGETEQKLKTVVEDFVWRLTGKETIYQMIALADAVRERGGSPLEPLVYKKMYLDLLWTRIRDRVEALRSGQASPEDYLVPGSRAMLETLRDRGMRMYLASGTDEIYMKEEARLLEIEHYFDGGVYGALDDYKSFRSEERRVGK